MTPRTWLGAACAGLLLTAAPSWANTWYRAQSEHFTVYSDSSSAVAKLFATRLEGYHDVLYLLYQMKNPGAETATPRFDVVLLKDRMEMREVSPHIDELIAGFYTQCGEGSVAYATFEINDGNARVGSHLGTAQADFDNTTVFHEYAHHFMFQNYTTPLPRWYVEGFAEYFMTMTLHGRDIAIGTARQERYSDLFTNVWFDYADILRDKVTYRSDSDQLKFYAQSWLLTHYIMSSPERLKAFGAYIDAVNAGADPVAAFEAKFGVKVADLPSVLKAYLAKGVPVVSFTLKTMAEPAVTVTEMPKSADKLLLWGSAVRGCAPSEYRPALLGKIEAEAARYPGDALAETTLQRAEIVIGDASKTEAATLARADAHPDDAEAQYLLGRLNYRKAVEHHDADAMDRARKAFLLSYKLDSMSAPNLYYLSLAQATLNGPSSKSAVGAAVQASNLAPSVTLYAYNAARMLIESGDYEDATTLLTPAASDPHNPENATQARAIIDALKAGKDKDTILAMFGGDDE
ncbi:DUF1570 domain-containing protein [Asticcacaulis solisilvae]|uniref:DUF1570 domain-containing protein n=1 Tax=Asticcacaulis solisilvae TaxID=1217274 RepID=UPI003FD7DE0E